MEIVEMIVNEGEHYIAIAISWIAMRGINLDTTSSEYQDCCQGQENVHMEWGIISTPYVRSLLELCVPSSVGRTLEKLPRSGRVVDHGMTKGFYVNTGNLSYHQLGAETNEGLE